MENTNKNTEMPQSCKNAVSGSAFLIGKAQIDFWEWYLLPETLKFYKLTSQHKYSNGNAIKVCFLSRSITEKNAIIIDWFDSVLIYIGINKTSEFYYQSSITVQNGTGFINTEMITHQLKRQESIKFSIEKANSMYNDQADR